MASVKSANGPVVFQFVVPTRLPPRLSKASARVGSSRMASVQIRKLARSNSFLPIQAVGTAGKYADIANFRIESDRLGTVLDGLIVVLLLDLGAETSMVEGRIAFRVKPDSLGKVQEGLFVVLVLDPARALRAREGDKG